MTAYDPSRPFSNLLRTSLFVEEVLPAYDVHAHKPLKALTESVGSCAARAAVAGVDLEQCDFAVRFLIHKLHGTDKSDPMHASIEVVVPGASDAFIIDSDHTANVKPTLWVPKVRERYNSFPLEEGISEYLMLSGDQQGANEFNIDSLREAVQVLRAD